MSPLFKPKMMSSPKMSPPMDEENKSIVDAIMHKHAMKKMAEGGMVDIDTNNEEQPNMMDELNEEALDSDLDSTMDEMPSEDTIESEDDDMVSKIMKKSKKI